jgi:ElaB/YqjD/DUF883 family membrane-anchored ribosome-binding protein
MDDAVKSEVEALRSDFKKISEDLKGLSKAIGELTRKQAADGVDELRQRRDKVEAQLRQAAGEARSSLEDHVREKPLNTLLIAFTVGLVLGRGLGR